MPKSKSNTSSKSTAPAGKKRTKDPHAPKRYRNAYFLFSAEKRDEVKVRKPRSSPTVSERSFVRCLERKSRPFSERSDFGTRCPMESGGRSRKQFSSLVSSRFDPFVSRRNNVFKSCLTAKRRPTKRRWPRTRARKARRTRRTRKISRRRNRRKTGK